MKKAKVVFLAFVIVSKDAFALSPSDIDISPFLTDLSVLIASFLSFLVLLMGYKKVLSLMGR